MRSMRGRIRLTECQSLAPNRAVGDIEVSVKGLRRATPGVWAIEQLARTPSSTCSCSASPAHHDVASLLDRKNETRQQSRRGRQENSDLRRVRRCFESVYS